MNTPGYKTKTIKSIIRKKINSWLESIEDEEVRKLAKYNTIVTGGCIASMLLGEKVNDFDLYFRNKETTLAVARYYLKKATPPNGCEMYVEALEDRVRTVIKSAGVVAAGKEDTPYAYFESLPDERAQSYVETVMQDPGDIEEVYEEQNETAQESETPGYKPVFVSTNAITLSGRIQIITRFFGEPDQIHENYDFVHCTNYWDSGKDTLVLRQAALEALMARELVYVGSKYPICSLIRIRKFIRRGYTINAGQILKICLQISELDLTNPKVLEEQLTGVDVAYFRQVIERLKEKDPEKVNTTYLVEIIDRMF